MKLVVSDLYKQAVSALERGRPRYEKKAPPRSLRVNPSEADMPGMGETRFIRLRNGSLYVWDSREGTHDSVMMSLNIPLSSVVEQGYND